MPRRNDVKRGDNNDQGFSLAAYKCSPIQRVHVFSCTSPQSVVYHRAEGLVIIQDGTVQIPTICMGRVDEIEAVYLFGHATIRTLEFIG